VTTVSRRCRAERAASLVLCGGRCGIDLSLDGHGEGCTDIYVDRDLVHELGRAGLQIACIEELTVAEDRATAIGAFGMALFDGGRLAVLVRVRLAIDLTRRIGGRCAASVTSCHALVATIDGLVVISTAFPTLPVPGVGTRGVTTIAVIGAGALAVAIAGAITVTYVGRARWRCGASALLHADRLT